MPRPTSAAHVLPDPASDPSLSRDPANDVATRERESAPVYVLTGADRARLTALAVALPHVASRSLDARDERFAWLRAIQARAWRDRVALASVAFGDDAPVTPDEIHEMGLRIEFTGELFAARGLVPSVEPSPEGAEPRALTDAQLATEMRRHQLTLTDPLTRRFRRSNEPAATLRVKRESVHAVVVSRALSSLTSNNQRLFALCDDAAVAAWIATLPKGEGRALARLRALHPEWLRRHRDEATGANAPEVPDLPMRAWRLATEILPRVLEAGRYLVKGTPQREDDYRAFVAKASHKRPAKSDATPTTPDASPTKPDA